MDLVQRKLTRDEWNSVEIPVSIDEKKIIKLIIDGYHDINLIENYNQSIIQFLKINYSDNMDNHLYKTYFMEIVKEQVKNYDLNYSCDIKNNTTIIKKIDSLRLIKNDIKIIKEKKDEIFDYLLLVIVGKILKNKKSDNKRWNYYYYTLYKIKDFKIKNVNKKVLEYVNFIIDLFKNEINLLSMIEKSYEYVEKNEFIYSLGDIKLYDHQKNLFTIFKKPENDTIQESAKLVLYIAPTATGKTLSPIGLSEGYRIIFVCAARHVGMSLAKSAISAGKKIALGFGCDSHEDIRLHLFSGSVFAKHEYRNEGNRHQKCICGKKVCGKIGLDFKYKDGTRKMDHSVGDKVEIMICDVQSYINSMYYMCAFNDKNNIITYWDEPTITMDYDSHPCHDTIKKNWSENIIPNIVLSSATLPKEEEINSVIMDFRNKFMTSDVRPQVHTVISHDCKKSIPIINKAGYIELPHLICKSYDDVVKCVDHCKDYLTVLRYFDLYETSRFVTYICKNSEEYLQDNRYDMDNYFESLDDINMSQIKKYYLLLLGHIKEEKVEQLNQYFTSSRNYKIKPNTKEIDNKSKAPIIQNGAYISTRDSHTITDGPAIFIAHDVDKIGKFCIQQANIPASKMNEISETIITNNVIKEKINKLDKSIEDATASMESKDNKASNDNRLPPNVKQMMKEIESLYKMVKRVALDDVYVPNKQNHLKKWVEDDLYKDTLPYTSEIDDSDVEEIMMLNDIENIWKVLLLLGIGLFSQTKCIAYTEVVKRLATQQKLYLIIANGDYIYGTNYQFCHGFIGKDVEQMTQEKAIQAFGRIGRNKLQQTYTVRLRDDTLVKKIFFKEYDKVEVRNMNLLFNSD